MYETNSISWYNHLRHTTMENMKATGKIYASDMRMITRWVMNISSGLPDLEWASLTHTAQHIAKKIGQLTERNNYISRQNIPNTHLRTPLESIKYLWTWMIRKPQDTMVFRANFLNLVPFHLREYYANLSLYLSLNANSLMCWNLLRSLPSLKKIDRLCKDNYRPVSILTALSNQLLFYFEELFSKFLSGFRNGTAVKVHC